MADPEPTTTNPEPTTDNPQPLTIEDFLQIRTKLSKDLIRLSTQVQVENWPLLFITEKLLHVLIQFRLLTVGRLFSDALPHHIDACYPHRTSALSWGFIKVRNMINEGTRRSQCALAMIMLSKQIGRLTLPGVADPFAETMDAEVRMMLNMWGDLDVPLVGFGEFGSQDLHDFWRSIDVVVPTCGCQQCRARR